MFILQEKNTKLNIIWMLDDLFLRTLRFGDIKHYLFLPGKAANRRDEWTDWLREVKGQGANSLLRRGRAVRGTSMVFILDGCSFDYAHTWSKSGISICWRHLVTSKESSNPILFSEKDLVFIIRAQREMGNHLI